MAYIGRDTDKISNVEVLDNITFDGSSSYTLQKGGSNFTPSSANTLLVSINGVVQAGNFTVSGSTIDFGTAVAGTSTCDFILHYGIGLITTPADGTVTTAKIGNGAVTSAKLASGVGGKVLQVVQTVFTGAKSTSSTSLVDVAGASVSITPSSTSSKVLVFVHANDSQKGNDSAVSGTMALLRGATQLIQLGGQIGYTGAANYNNVGTVSALYLDSPATTSSTTYKLQFSTNSGNTFYINANSNTDSMITAMEISA